LPSARVLAQRDIHQSLTRTCNAALQALQGPSVPLVSMMPTYSVRVHRDSFSTKTLVASLRRRATSQAPARLWVAECVPEASARVWPAFSTTESRWQRERLWLLLLLFLSAGYRRCISVSYSAALSRRPFATVLSSAGPPVETRPKLRLRPTSCPSQQSKQGQLHIDWNHSIPIYTHSTTHLPGHTLILTPQTVPTD
jgi:hypothetical protein